MIMLKENKRRIISLILAIFILMTSIPIPVIAEEIQNGDVSQGIVGEGSNENGSNDEILSENENENLGGNETETEIKIDGAEEQSIEASEENEIAVLNEETQTEEGKFKIALRWGGTSNTAYTWNATKSENRVIKLKMKLNCLENVIYSMKKHFRRQMSKNVF